MVLQGHDKLKPSYLHSAYGRKTWLFWCPILRDSYPYSHMTIYSRGVARSCDELETYRYNHNTYGHQTWQGGELPLIKLQDLLVMWFCEVMLRIEYFTIPVALD